MASPLTVLPAQVANIAAAIAEGNYQVTKASAQRWFPPHEIGDCACLTNIRVKLAMAFTRRSSSTILFFFHNDPTVYSPLTASVAFAAQPRQLPRSATPTGRHYPAPSSN